LIVLANEESEEYFLRATRQLLPVSRRVKIELENALAEKRDLFSTNFEWTSAPQVMGFGIKHRKLVFFYDAHCSSETTQH